MRENQRVMISKTLLKKSLIELMKEKDIDKISISELCKNAGINRTTFYNHYLMPKDILKEIEESMINDLQIILKENKSDGEISLAKAVELICNYLRENYDVSKLLFKNNSIDSEFAKQLLLIPKDHAEFYYYFSSKCDEETNNLMMSFVQNGIYNLIRLWLINNMNKSSQEIGELINGIAMNGWLKK